MRPLRSAHGLALALLLLLGAGCRGTLELTPSDADVVLARQTLDAPDPGQPGPYAVRTLYYGSGTDRNRPEYRDSVTITTGSVDASKLVDLGSRARERNEYWGFTPEEFPLNARVWYPDGDGPFPLALVVHGNHDMRDFSDPGYDYLGELLASRGVILASVDMNFINGTSDENDGRGWLLLKHLEAWKGFNDDSGSPLAGKVDMTRLAVMGHSRGGEAAPVAATFNRLPRYPDDASLEFDFGFDIRAVVSIAPVDGQYLPTGRPMPVENVDYLVFHGSHDGDVTSFHGLRIWDRLTYPDSGDHFKSAIYMYRANHGQWNTVWNSFDTGGDRAPRILDLRYLVPPEDQRRFAELYVTAFLEASLKGDRRWLSMFRDHRVVGQWLPESMYVTRLQHASFRPLADFEEDVDVTTGSVAGVGLRGDSLATWREERLALRSSNRANTSASQDNQALRVGWNNRLAGADTTRTGPAARFEVALPAALAGEWGLGPAHSLELSLSATDRLPSPRRPPDDAGDEEAEAADRSSRRSRPDPDAPKPPVDLSVEVEDASGTRVSVPLSDYGPIRRPLEIHILRRTDLETRLPSELILQSYHIPLTDFTDREPGLDLSTIRAVRLVFDRAVAGEVVVDDVGFSAMGPEFWRARVR